MTRRPFRTRFRPGLLSLETREVPAVVLSDNLANAAGGTDAATATRWLASSFRTDATARSLTDVTLKLGSLAGGTPAVDLYTDATLTPASKLATLVTPAGLVAGGGDTAFTGSVPLAANATFWVVLRATAGSVPWTFTADNSGTGAGFQAGFAESDDSGATWFSGSIFPTQMRVTADGTATAGGPGVLQFTAATFAVNEGVGTATVTVSRTGGSTGAVTVPVTVTGGTATAGADFTVPASPLAFADGATTATVSIPVVNDALAEGAETILLALGTPAGGATLGGTSTATVTITDDDGGTAPATGRTPLYAVAQGSGGSAVNLYNADGSLRRTVQPFPGFTGGARVATADLTGDGVDDLVAGAGPGGSPQVAVFDGATGAELARFAAFESAFTGGVYVAAGDVDADGRADVAVTPDQGGGPVVALYSGAGLAAGRGAASQVSRFFGIDDPNFRGGARPALGDASNDGRADLVVAAGFGGGPRVALFNGASLAGTPVKLAGDFFAFEQTLRNGTFVAADNGRLVVAGGPGGGPRVRVFDAARLLAAGPFATLDEVAGQAQTADFFAGDPSSRGGVRVGFGDATGDGTTDFLFGSGDGEAGRVRVYTPTALNTAAAAAREFDLFGLTLAGGVFVG